MTFKGPFLRRPLDAMLQDKGVNRGSAQGDRASPEGQGQTEEVLREAEPVPKGRGRSPGQQEVASQTAAPGHDRGAAKAGEADTGSSGEKTGVYLGN